MLFLPYSASGIARVCARFWFVSLLLAVGAAGLWIHDERHPAQAENIIQDKAVSSPSSTLVSLPLGVLPAHPTAHEQRVVAQDKAMIAGLKGQLLHELLPSSPLLEGKQISAWVYLPPTYNTSNARYPVAYLLHGAPGGPRDMFVNAQAHRVAEQLILQGQIAPTILVSFDGFGPQGVDDVQNYLNRVDGSYSMESFFVQTFVPWVDAHFRTRANAQSRALIGFSAGGYGAANLGAKHPDMWKVVASISGFFDPNDDAENMTKLLGPKSKLWDDNSPLLRAHELPKGQRLHFYMDCGSDDSLYHEFLKMQKVLKKRKADYEAQSLPGDHTWDYVHDRLFDALQFCDRRWKEMT